MADETVDPVKSGRSTIEQEKWDAGAGARRQKKIKEVAIGAAKAVGSIGTGVESVIASVGSAIGNIPEFVVEQDKANTAQKARFNSEQRIADYKKDLKRAAARFVEVPTKENKRIYNDILSGFNAEIKTYESLGGKYVGEKYGPLTDKAGTPDGVLKDTAIGAPKTAKSSQTKQGTLNKLSKMEDKVGKAEFAKSDSGLQLSADTAAIVAGLRSVGINPTLEAIAAAQAMNAPATGSGGGGGGYARQASYNVYSNEQTQSIADSVAQNLLGRALTADELTRVTQNLNIESKANPSITQSTGGMTVQSGGINEQQSVKNQLELAPEYKNYQQATTYFDAMLGALRGPAGGGI